MVNMSKSWLGAEMQRVYGLVVVIRFGRLSRLRGRFEIGGAETHLHGHVV